MAQFGKLLEWGKSNLERMGTKELLRTSLSKMEASWRGEKMAQAFSRYIPQIAKLFLTKAGQGAQDFLPPLPTGRPSLDVHTKGKVVKFALSKIGESCSVEQTKKRAATRFGVSEATVQRTWDDRANIGEPDSRDVLNALQDPD